MGRMNERLAQLRTLSHAAIVLLGGTLPAGSQEPAAPAAVSGTVYNIEVIVFRATTALGVAENWSAEAGERSIAGDESASAAAQIGHFVAQLPASSWGTRAGFPVQRLGLNVPGLGGTVFLERGQFLHLGMSLTYAMASPPEGLGAAEGTPFTLNQSRRVRFYERNYYDHPAFGVIALVTPLQGARAPGR
jgi:hypothetical protein